MKIALRNWFLNSGGTDAAQAAFDAIVAYADMFHSALPDSSGNGGVYSDDAVTTLVTSGEVKALKTSGNNTPKNLGTEIHLLTTSSSSTNVYYRDLAPVNRRPFLIDKGNLDAWLDVRNGDLGASVYLTNPGGFNPTVQEEIDVIEFFRYTNVIPYEASGLWRANNTAIQGTLGNVTTTSITTATNWAFNKEYRLRMYSNGAGAGASTTTIWMDDIDGTPIGTASSQNVPSWTEWTIGTTSHAMSMQWRLRIVKFGQFTTEELADIQSKAESLWPVGTSTNYPSVIGLQPFGSSQWDYANKGWRFGQGQTVTFSGGTGVAGTHLFRFYWQDTTDATLFPEANSLEEHRALPYCFGGAAWTTGQGVDALEINGISLIGSSVEWNTDLDTSLDALVTEINSNQSTFFAYHKAGLTGVWIFHITDDFFEGDTSVSFTSTCDFVDVLTPPPLTYNDWNRTDYDQDGYIWDGAVSAQFYVFGVFIPRDDAGTEGVKFKTARQLDNIGY